MYKNNKDNCPINNYNSELKYNNNNYYNSYYNSYNKNNNNNFYNKYYSKKNCKTYNYNNNYYLDEEGEEEEEENEEEKSIKKEDGKKDYFKNNYYKNKINNNNYNRKYYHSDDEEEDEDEEEYKKDNDYYKNFKYNNNYNGKYYFSEDEEKFYNNSYYHYNYNDYYSESDFDEESFENDFLEDDEYYQIKTLEDKEENGEMYELPKINERLIILDTEVSGKTEKDHIIEICAFEMINGKLNPKKKFHSFFKPKNHMKKYLIKIHRIPKKAFYYSFDKEKEILLNFLNFIKDSLIITHNAKFDMEKINKALSFYNLPLINHSKFRCSMRIFLEYYSFFSLKFSKLKECCEYFHIKYKRHRLHLASYDAFLTGKIMEKIFQDQMKKINNENKIRDKDNIFSFDNHLFEYNKIKQNNINNFDKIRNLGKENLYINNNSNKNIEDKNDKEDLEDFIDKNIEEIVKEVKEEEKMQKIINENIDEIIALLNEDKNESKSFLLKKRK